MKALERIPLWKRVSALPDRMEAMEARLAALELKIAGGHGAACPICEAPGFKRTASKPHPTFAFVGLKTDTYSCGACGHSETRDRDAGADARR